MDDRVELRVGPVVAIPAVDLVRAALVPADVILLSSGRVSIRVTFQVDGEQRDWSELLAQGYFET